MKRRGGGVSLSYTAALGSWLRLLPSLLAGPHLEVVLVNTAGLCGEVAAVPSHDLVDYKHAGGSGRLVDDVLEEVRRGGSGSHGAEGLDDGVDVVVDCLRQ